MKRRLHARAELRPQLPRFRARKPQYEQHVRGPMIALLARLAEDFRRFAPELVSDSAPAVAVAWLSQARGGGAPHRGW